MRQFLLALVALLLALPAPASVTRGATTTNASLTGTISNADGNFSHTVDSGTTLTLLTVCLEGLEIVNPTPVWDSATANETFTLVHDNGLQADNGDVRCYAYGLVSPTAKTAQIDLDWNGSALQVCIHAVNYAGTETSSVAAATNFLSEDVNATPSGSMVHASAGTAGNALVMFGCAIGGDMDPATQSAGTTFNEIFDGATGTDTTSDASYWYGDLGNQAPSAITVDWAGNDENSSIFIEIVAASGGSSTIPVIMHHRNVNND